MSKQKIPSLNKNNPKEKREYEILNLEQKYFDLLANVFGSKDFKNSLLETEKWTNYHYLNLHTWKKSNKVQLACQRLVFFNVLKTLDKEIIGTYNSSISSDVAFETKDAVINIDSKTINFDKNKLDWKRPFFGPNQSSFRNINWGTKGNENTNFGGFKVQFNLFPYDNFLGKPVLSYLISFLYRDKKGDDKFSWYRDAHENKDEFDFNMKLTVIPNGLLSKHFDNDLIVGAKTYKYKKKEGKYVQHIKKENIPNHSKLEAINVETKPGWYDPLTDIPWLETESGTGKNRKMVFRHTTGIDSVRMKYDILRERYNGKGKHWDALKNWKI